MEGNKRERIRKLDKHKKKASFSISYKLSPISIQHLWLTSSNRSMARYGGPRSDTNPAKAMPSSTFIRKSSSAIVLCPKNAPGEKTTSFKGLSMTLSICVWNVILGLHTYGSVWRVQGGCELYADTIDSPERDGRIATGRQRGSPYPAAHTKQWHSRKTITSCNVTSISFSVNKKNFYISRCDVRCCRLLKEGGKAYL